MFHQAPPQFRKRFQISSYIEKSHDNVHQQPSVILKDYLSGIGNICTLAFHAQYKTLTPFHREEHIFALRRIKDKGQKGRQVPKRKIQEIILKT